MGGGDGHADAIGGRIFLDIDCEEEPRGGEASWLRRSDIDERGFMAGWEERASAMRFRYVFDAEGFLCLRQGGRLESHQLGQLDPAVQIAARARLALGDVEVIPGDGIKRQETHVQLSTQRELWGKLTTWSARICATRIYTLDGGWREVETENGGKTRIATRAAIDHEGHILGGRIFEADVKADNYIAELAAQLDALTDAVGRGSGERVISPSRIASPDRTSAPPCSNSSCSETAHTSPSCPPSRVRRRAASRGLITTRRRAPAEAWISRHPSRRVRHPNGHHSAWSSLRTILLAYG